MMDKKMDNNDKRIPRENWLQIGLEILSKSGFSYLTIERLCKYVNRSKGSFYFHFTSIEDYKVELLTYWEKTHTSDVEQAVAAHTTAIARRKALPSLAAGLSNDIERAIRVWSETDEKAKVVVSRTDKRRIEFVADAIFETENISKTAALKLATIEYAAFLGFQQILRDRTEDERKAFFQATQYLISPSLSKQEN